MNKNPLIFAGMIVIAAAFILVNEVSAGNLPETPIDKILNYKTGLDLSDSQVKNLSLVNNNIVNKMIQVKGQAQRLKLQIDQIASNWADLDNPKAKGAVKEYYQCLADLKTLEFEAMAQASKILSGQQIDKFNELATIEVIMGDTDKAAVAVR
jgi:hypothetical protein